MPTRVCLALILPAALAALACQKPVEPVPVAKIEKDYNRALPPGAFALEKVDPEDYPDFGDAWYRAKRLGLRKSVAHSLAYLKTPTSKQFYPLGPITHERVVASLEKFLDLLDQSDTPEKLNDLIARNFDVYRSIGCDDDGTVLFTGYYSPIFEGSRQRTDRFKFPLYKLPKGIEKDRYGEVIGGPWKERKDIEGDVGLVGSELVWLEDRFEAYVLSVQGSGFIRLPNGELYEIGYAGNNGHDYTPIGHMLVSDGHIDKHKLSLATMIKYFKDHPEDMDKYLFANKRYIFFKDVGGGPFGCLGQPVTSEFSVATDKDIFPRGALAFVDTNAPNGEQRRTSFRSFVLDQDRGAAIRAPGRCDIYMGVGEEAGKKAGWTYSEGHLYYLLCKDAPLPSGDLADAAEAPPLPKPRKAREVDERLIIEKTSGQ